MVLTTVLVGMCIIATAIRPGWTNGLLNSQLILFLVLVIVDFVIDVALLVRILSGEGVL